jgi:hypothetical protein
VIAKSRQKNGGLGVQRWSALLASAFFAAGCVVSFDDYPVDDLGGSMSTGAGATGGSNGSGASGGSASKGGTAGLASGGGDRGGTAGDIGVGGEAGTVVIDADLIDDFEDGDDVILGNDGRQGTWYVANDGMGIQDPGSGELVAPAALLPARDQSLRALHTSGGGFSVWGAFVRAYLRVEGGTNQPYDASRYTGVRFFARSGDDEEHLAFLMLPTVETTTCPGCGDHFGTEFNYSSEWQEYRLPFDEMEQRGLGPPRPALMKREIVAVQVLFEDGVAFDLWIDDLGFY